MCWKKEKVEFFYIWEQKHNCVLKKPDYSKEIEETINFKKNELINNELNKDKDNYERIKEYLDENISIRGKYKYYKFCFNFINRVGKETNYKYSIEEYLSLQDVLVKDNFYENPKEIEKLIDIISKTSIDYKNLRIILNSLYVKDINEFNIKFLLSLEENEKKWFYLQ